MIKMDMEVSHMIKREFVQPTQDEIEERRCMRKQKLLALT